MAGTTDYLQLSLPGLGEFNNTWHSPLNENFETLDDFAKNIDDALVSGTVQQANYISLTGNFANLAERINESIGADGSVDLSSSPEIADLANSLVNGDYESGSPAAPSPSHRFEVSDLELYGGRNPIPSERFSPSAPTGDQAWLDVASGVSLLTRDFNSPSYSPATMEGGVVTPQAPGGHGYIQGPASLLATGGNGVVKLDASDADGNRALFNIDGYLFRLREPILLDLTKAGMSGGEKVFIYAERTDYANAANYYSLGSSIVSDSVNKDLRKLQEGTDGIAAGSTFTSAGADFINANEDDESPVKERDLLVIYGGTDSDGSYVIESVDGAGQLTILGSFRADAGSLAWYIWDASIPNIGFEEAAFTTDPPSKSSGRALIGEVVYQGSGAQVNNIKTYAQNGVYDSGWLAGKDIDDFPLTVSHNLGVQPAHVDIWMRQALGGSPSNTADIYRPVLLREFSLIVDTNFPNPAALDLDSIDIWIPSVHCRSTAYDLILKAIGAPSTGNQHPAKALFTDEGGTDYGASGGNDVDIRVVVRR